MLLEFWKTTYDIDVDAEEKPLIIVKPYNLNLPLTYPPSCVFFDQQNLTIRASVQGFIEYRKRNLQQRTFNVMVQVLQDLRIGEKKLILTGNLSTNTDVQRMILHDLRGRLLNRQVKASGSIVKVSERMYFFPKTLEGIS